MALPVLSIWAKTATAERCSAVVPPEYRNFHHMPVSGSWFDVYEVAPAVFAIYEPQQAEKTISYLIAGRKRALLFDTGMGIGDIKRVTADLTRLPVIVLNSHTHNDHVGGNWQFQTVHGMDTDFTRLNAQGSREDAQAEITDHQICGALPAGFDRSTYATRPWKIRASLHDGERIDLGGRALTVIATPGHTPDSICLWDTASDLLFTGDTYYPGKLWLYRPETNLAAYESSVMRLAALEPHLRMVLGAHNVPVASPSVLSNLVTAFQAVRDHKIPAAVAGIGKVVYRVGDISFLLRAPEPTR